jgi:hypothetical protein
VSNPTAKRRLLSTQAHLLMLAVALIGPLLVFTGLILLRYADAEQARIEQDVRDSVEELAVSVDRELVGLQYTLLALATAPTLLREDFETFHNFATDVARARDATIVLRDAESQQVINTSLPWGGPAAGRHQSARGRP